MIRCNNRFRHEEFYGGPLPDTAKRPDGEPTPSDREKLSEEQALSEFPRGTRVGREFADAEGNMQVFYGKVWGFRDPYWRVEHSDGDWEELNRQEMRQGVAAAVRVPPAPQDS